MMGWVWKDSPTYFHCILEEIWIFINSLSSSLFFFFFFWGGGGGGGGGGGVNVFVFGKLKNYSNVRMLGLAFSCLLNLFMISALPLPYTRGNWFLHLLVVILD
jgi:hypothetical protein